MSNFAPNRCRDQPRKSPVVQSHGITLSFHREMADASRELVGSDITAAVRFESYPRFIKGGLLGSHPKAPATRTPAVRVLPGARHRHCDHGEPHHGDVNKFWLGPFMSLCKRWHGRVAQALV
jgi:hypothetical protein